MVRLLNISQLSTELSRETGSPGQTLWSHYKSWETLISHFPHCHVNLYHWYSQLVLQDIEFYQTLVIRWAMTDIYRLKLASNLDRNIDKTPKVMSKLNPLQFPECWKHQDIITSIQKQEVTLNERKIVIHFGLLSLLECILWRTFLYNFCTLKTLELNCRENVWKMFRLEIINELSSTVDI